jgi:hypothetical protein
MSMADVSMLVGLAIVVVVLAWTVLAGIKRHRQHPYS